MRVSQKFKNRIIRDKEEGNGILQGKSSNHKADSTLDKNNRVVRRIRKGEINME